MKTFKILTIIAITGATAITAGNIDQGCTNQYNITIGDHASQAEMHKKQKRANPNRGINRLLRRLDLTEAQKAQLKEIRKSMWQARKAERKNHKGQLGLKKFVSVDGFDKEGFIEASQERSKAMTGVRAEMMEKFIAVLTPEQRIEMMEKLNKQRRGKRHQQQ